MNPLYRYTCPVYSPQGNSVQAFDWPLMKRQSCPVTMPTAYVWWGTQLP
uniref:Uncharacterized protein n=1 Tax=Anguilla anguilla TaxID=7936 RepID=A0A0E9SUE2_ANGAN